MVGVRSVQELVLKVQGSHYPLSSTTSVLTDIYACHKDGKILPVGDGEECNCCGNGSGPCKFKGVNYTESDLIFLIANRGFEVKD